MRNKWVDKAFGLFGNKFNVESHIMVWGDLTDHGHHNYHTRVEELRFLLSSIGHMHTTIYELDWVHNDHDSFVCQYPNPGFCKSKRIIIFSELD